MKNTTLDQFITGLIDALKQRDATIEPSATEIADALWLAMRITPERQQLAEKTALGAGEESAEDRTESSEGNESAARTESPEGQESGVSATAGDSASSASPASSANAVQPALEPEPEPEPVPEPAAALHTTRTGQDDIALRTPDAAALHNKLRLIRSLRPFKHTVPSRTAVELDECATVAQIAETGLWYPALRPRPTRWFDVALVVDAGRSMVIWHNLIDELREMLEHLGAFRNITLWHIDTDVSDDNGKVRLYAGRTTNGKRARQPHHYDEVIDPTGRRLILLVSDCISPAWRTGAIGDCIGAWGKHNLVTIVQVLPQRLWLWSALGNSLDYMQMPHAAAANSRLRRIHRGWLPPSPLPPGMLTPVTILEPYALDLWARMVTGATEIVFPGKHIATSTRTTYHAPTYDNESEMDAEERVDRFWRSATNEARELAARLAAIPVSLPTMRLVQHTRHFTHSHVAEVFLGGLLYVHTPHNHPNLVRYEFYDDVRDILLDALSSDDVIATLSLYVSNHLGKTRDFTAYVNIDELYQEVQQVAKDNPHFAELTADVLRDMGSQFRELVTRLTAPEAPPVALSPETTEAPPVPPVHGGETADSPPYTGGLGGKTPPTNPLFPVTIAEWEQELAKCNETFGRPDGYWCYVRPATYKIGGWKKDEESADIDLLAFWIAKHPITVQQYRIFMNDGGYNNEAYWTENGWKWNQDTNRTQPRWWDDERFNNDNQPIVGVTWYEATAFAAWLTKKLEHTLPNGYRVRLPTEAEWEGAAAYDAEWHCRTYPWGEDAPTPEQAVYKDEEHGIKPDRPAIVGERPDGAAACGAHDMVGNVWEMACSSYAGYPAKAADVVADFTRNKLDVPWRGGTYYSEPNRIDCAVRLMNLPRDDYFNIIGLRVVVSH